jgi:hypothetical protein
MRRLFAYLGVGFALMLAPACHEDIDVFEPAPLASGDIMRFFTQVQTPPMVYHWDAAEEQTLILPDKSRVFIPADAFIDMDGVLATGTLEASIIELRGKGSLIRNNIGTAAANLLLESAGVLHLDVRHQGRSLRLAPGQSIQIQLVVKAYHPQLRLFAAEPGESGKLEWAEAAFGGETPIQAVQIFNAETNQWLPGVEFATARLGWLQCARYADSSITGKAAITSLKLPVGFSSGNTVVFLAMQNMDMVIPFLDFAEGLPKVSRENLPTGYKAEFIVVAEGEEGIYFFARQPIIITEHLSIEVVPQKMALPEILAALDGL